MKLNIAALILDSKTVEFDYPGHEGFKVELTHMSTGKLAEIRKDCVKTIYNTQMGVPVQELDQEKWLTAFTKAVIVGWKGFTYAMLAEMLLIDESAIEDLDATVEYSVDNAVTLISKCSQFDGWVNNCLNDINNFRNSK